MQEIATRTQTKKSLVKFDKKEFSNILQIKNEWAQSYTSFFKQRVQQNIREFAQEKQGKLSFANTALKQLFQEIDKHFHPFQPEISEIMQLIKTKMQKNICGLMTKKQMSFYFSAIKLNEQLQNVGYTEKWNNYRKKEEMMTVENLFKLDILFIFLQENQLNQYNCKHNSHRLFSLQEISQIIKIDKQQIKRFEAIYLNVYPFVYPSFSCQIEELIIIVSLIKTKSRISNFIRRSLRNVCPIITNFLMEQDYKQEQIQRFCYQQQIVGDFMFHFCELCFIKSKKYGQTLTNKYEQQFRKNIQQVLQSCEQTRKKSLLVTKCKFNLSFRAIFKFIQWMVKKDQAMMASLFYEDQEIHIDQLKSFLKFAFLKYKTFEAALEVFKFQKKIGIKPLFSQIRKKKPQILEHIVIDIKNRYNLLSKVLKVQIQLQKSVRKLLIIKKCSFSFYQLKGKNDQTEKKHKDKDLVLTLILASIETKIQFIYITPGDISDQTYLKLVKKGVQRTKINYPFTIVLDDLYLNKNLTWRFYFAFAKRMKATFGSRVYIANSTQFCNLNILLYAHLKCYLKTVAQKIQRQNFFRTTENYIVKKLRSLKIRFKQKL